MNPIHEIPADIIMANALNTIDLALSIYDVSGRLLYGNDLFYQLLHVTDPGSAIGKTASELAEEGRIAILSAQTGEKSEKITEVIRRGRKVANWELILHPLDQAAGQKHVLQTLAPIYSKSQKLIGVIETLSPHREAKRASREPAPAAKYTFNDIIGESRSMLQIIQRAETFAAAGKSSVLILGESGAGKELFAQAIHNGSSYRNGPFVALNCANFPENLFESELFGYVGGAFTGASKGGQPGKFELAHGGTLFLDEIGEMPLLFQSKLLRALETGRIMRIGGTQEIAVDVRVIAATNRNLPQMAAEGTFRKDLYYRLQVLTLEIPPLRQRKEDIRRLSQTFLREVSLYLGTFEKTLDKAAEEHLLRYDWPGNVRELRNVIHRAAVLSDYPVIGPKEIGESMRTGSIHFSASDTARERLEKCRRDIDHATANLLNAALDIACGDKAEAARQIGVSQATFYRMLKKYASTESE